MRIHGHFAPILFQDPRGEFIEEIRRKLRVRRRHAERQRVVAKAFPIFFNGHVHETEFRTAPERSFALPGSA
jgi:hypothetical protein